MAELWFKPEADAALTELESDVGRADLLTAVNRVLDRLARDPGGASVRRVRFHRQPLWGVPIFAGDEEWVLLWELHPERPEDIAVQDIGPASFA